MPKKTKSQEEHLQTIEYLLAGLLLEREVTVNEVAKVIGCSNYTLIKLYPMHRKKRKVV